MLNKVLKTKAIGSSIRGQTKDSPNHSLTNVPEKTILSCRPVVGEGETDTRT
jgi:hypothetical protein